MRYLSMKFKSIRQNLSVAYMVYLREIRLMGSAGLMHNLLKMMVVADSAGDASSVRMHAYKAYSECRI